jgi:hypothetical protein
VLSLELDGRQHSIPDLLAHRIAKHLDVIKHALPSFLAGFVNPAPNCERGRRQPSPCWSTANETRSGSPSKINASKSAISHALRRILG